MKFFLDTANVKEIKQWAHTGIIDGVTTNPTHLHKESGNPSDVVRTICSLLPHGDISVEVTETEPAKVYAQAKLIAALAENITVKIPCHLSYYSVIDQLVTEGVAINVTLVFNLVQATAMCKLGVAYISPFIGRWDDIGVNGMTILQEIIEMVDEYDYEAQVLAASLRHVTHLQQAIALGADVLTTAPAVLSTALSHPLTDKGIQLFNQSWAQLGTTRFP
jgi:transaldolase